MKSKSLRYLSLWLALTLTFALAAACTFVPPAANTSDMESNTLPDLEITGTPEAAVPDMDSTVTETMGLTATTDVTDGTEMTDTEMTDTEMMTDSDMMTDTGMMDGMTATAQIDELDGSGVSGTVTFVQEGDSVMIMADIRGLEEGLHGIHVHENGSCEPGDSDNDGVDEPGGAAGGHFNPLDSPHGAPFDDEDARHVGDLGNIGASESNALLQTTDDLIALNGENSIVGLALIIHSDEDDYTTQPGGDSGSRIGCGIIEMQ